MTATTPNLVTSHVVPLGDWREHVLSPECWCRPEEDEEYPGLFVHISMDRREEYQQGRKMS